MNVTSPFPPSFQGSELAFGWALFSLTAITSFSLAIMLQMAVDWRRGDGTYPSNFVAALWGTMTRPLWIVRAGLALLLLTIFLGTIGDVAYLYAYGEVSPETQRLILLFDRSCDAAAFLPFAGFGALFIRGRNAVVHQLLRAPIPTDLWPTFPMVRRHLVVIGLVLFMATGVTIGK